MNGRLPRALSIAGSDSGGGAGIQADIKTFGALGVFGMTAITAVTVQNTQGVSAVQALEPSIVAAQITSVASDIGVDAAKTGMLANAGIVHAVVEAVQQAGIEKLVVDPVAVSKHGDLLLEGSAVDVLRAELLPVAMLVTPNLSEAEALSGLEVRTREDMRRAGDAIRAGGVKAVLVKGGHLDGGVAADLLVDGYGEEWLEAERIQTRHTHGTGCTLSASITAYLATGSDLRSSVRAGKVFVTKAIEHAIDLGRGIGPVDPLWMWSAPEESG
jgi:hydroxymethylpyrimidine/phosphomethylpyrimidine kinase